jgi:integrase
LRRAIAELSQNRREECKAFLLAIAIGLRRKEADHLMWQSFDFVAGTVQVQPTEHNALKTRESAATLVLDAEIMALFKGWHAQRTGNFVIESDRPPRDAGYHYYRADQVFDSLVKWLREQGITADKPFHSLRKIFGSLIVERHGKVWDLDPATIRRWRREGAPFHRINGENLPGRFLTVNWPLDGPKRCSQILASRRRREPPGRSSLPILRRDS